MPPNGQALESGPGEGSAQPTARIPDPQSQHLPLSPSLYLLTGKWAQGPSCRGQHVGSEAAAPPWATVWGAPLTPKGHEDREEDGGGVVEEVAGARRGAGRAHLPVAAGLVTQRAHGDVMSLVTHLHAGRQGQRGDGHPLGAAWAATRVPGPFPASARWTRSWALLPGPSLSCASTYDLTTLETGGLSARHTPRGLAQG